MPELFIYLLLLLNSIATFHIIFIHAVLLICRFVYKIFRLPKLRNGSPVHER